MWQRKGTTGEVEKECLVLDAVNVEGNDRDSEETEKYYGWKEDVGREEEKEVVSKSYVCLRRGRGEVLLYGVSVVGIGGV